MTVGGLALVSGAWVATLEHGELSTPAWPALLVVLSALASLAAAAAFVGAAVQEGRGRPVLAWIPPLLAILVAGAFSSLPRAMFASDAEVSTFTAFGAALDLAAAAVATPLLAVGLAAGAWLAAPAREGRVVALVGAGASAIAAISGFAVAAWSAWLLSVGPLPDATVDVPPRLHVGASVSLSPTAPPGWEAVPLELHATAPGPMPWRAELQRTGLTLTTRGETEAGTDAPSPLFPLARGNHWTYGASARWHDQYLWFVSSDHDVPEPGYAFTVTGDAHTAGVHTWTVQRTGRDEAPRTWTVYGWNGQTYTVADTGTSVPSPADEKFLELAGSPPASGPPAQECVFVGMPGYSCSCWLRPPTAEIRLPGPARCVATRGGIGSALLTGLVAIATLGLVIPDPDRTEVEELVGSGL